MELAELFSSLGIPAIIAAIVTGIYALMAKRADHSRPDLLSTGYSTFVQDMRKELAEVRSEADRLRGEVERLRFEILELEQQVTWLLSRVPLEDLEGFHKAFGFAKPLPVEDDE